MRFALALFAIVATSFACSSSTSGDATSGSAQDVKGTGTIGGAVQGTFNGAKIVGTCPTGTTAWSIGVNSGNGGTVSLTQPAGLASLELQFDLTFTLIPTPGTYDGKSLGVGSSFSGSISYSGGANNATGSYFAGTLDKTNTSSLSLTLKSLTKSNVTGGNDIYTAHGSIDASLVGGTQANGMGAIQKTAPITVHLDF